MLSQVDFTQINMKVDLKHIESLAKLHVPNAEEMTKRLEGALNYISELKQSNFDADF
jgi:Asp-tRNA(Asn)/Glu-tRNA(Gln) amidotransferase C subunit